MDYLKIYNNLIQKAQTRVEIIGYKERHHSIPKCMGGSNEKGNLVSLTAKEHFIAHLLLTKIYPHHDKILLAFNIMLNGASPYEARYSASNYYSIIRQQIGAAISRSLIGNKRAANFARDEAYLLKLNNGVLKGKYHPGFGKPLPEKTKRAVALANSRRVWSDKAKLAVSLAGRNRIWSDEARKEASKQATLRWVKRKQKQRQQKKEATQEEFPPLIEKCLAS